MLEKALALILALTFGCAVTASLADGPAPQTALCGRDSLWQQALDQTAPSQGGMANVQSCADPTRIQEAGGCCTGHGGPAGCDAETHKVICADGKKSKSCGC